MSVYDNLYFTYKGFLGEEKMKKKPNIFLGSSHYRGSQRF